MSFVKTMLKNRDVQIIGLLAILIAVLFLIGGARSNGVSHGQVNIYYGDTMESYLLGEERSVTIGQGSGHVNVVQITKDGAHMLSSTCENQICVNQGHVSIDDFLGWILCLPNDVSVQVAGPDA